MKTIGLLGGMSWHSTAKYYALMNEKVNKKMGKLHSAKIIINSIDFESVAPSQKELNWELVNSELLEEGKKIELGGADFIGICSNTGNASAEFIAENVNIPVIHIARSIGKELSLNGKKKIGLIGTKYTMQEDYIKKILTNEFDLEIVLPNQEEMEVINKVIYNELCFGKVNEKSKKELIEIVNNLEKAGADCLLLACTELQMIIKQEDTSIKVFDSTEIHVDDLVNHAMEEEK